MDGRVLWTVTCVSGPDDMGLIPDSRPDPTRKRISLQIRPGKFDRSLLNGYAPIMRSVMEPGNAEKQNGHFLF